MIIYISKQIFSAGSGPKNGTLPSFKAVFAGPLQVFGPGPTVGRRQKVAPNGRRPLFGWVDSQRRVAARRITSLFEDVSGWFPS